MIRGRSENLTEDRHRSMSRINTRHSWNQIGPSPAPELQTFCVASRGAEIQSLPGSALPLAAVTSAAKACARGRESDF